MIKNDFEKLNEDDWLAKEIARENRISAWDLDEGKKLRKEHEENCDARDNAEEHRIMHGLRRANEGRTGGLSVWFFIDLVFLVALFFISFALDSSVFPAIFLFLCLNPGIFVWLFLFKKTPSPGYLKSVFLITLFMELYILLMTNNYVRLLLWRYFR